MEDTDCEIICGAPATLAVKGLMMMMMKVPFFQNFQNYKLKIKQQRQVQDSMVCFAKTKQKQKQEGGKKFVFYS